MEAGRWISTFRSTGIADDTPCISIQKDFWECSLSYKVRELEKGWGRTESRQEFSTEPISSYEKNIDEHSL